MRCLRKYFTDRRKRMSSAGFGITLLAADGRAMVGARSARTYFIRPQQKQTLLAGQGTLTVIASATTEISEFSRYQFTFSNG